MKRTLLMAAMVLGLSLIGAHAAWAFGWKDVVKMHQAGIADSLIIQKIDHSGKRFHLESKELRALHEAGVSDEIISVMLDTEDRYAPGGPYYEGDTYHSPRVYLGFGYYHGYPYYYDGYPWYYGGYRYYGSYPRYYGGYYGGHYGGYYHGYTRYPSRERWGGYAPNYGNSRTRTQVGPDTKQRRR